MLGQALADNKTREGGIVLRCLRGFALIELLVVVAVGTEGAPGPVPQAEPPDGSRVPLVNGGFEMVPEGPAAARAGWKCRAGRPFQDAPIPEASVAPEAARTGKLGLVLRVNDCPRVLAQQALKLPDREGWYEFSAWARSVGDAPAAARLRLIVDTRKAGFAFLHKPNGRKPTEVRLQLVGWPYEADVHFDDAELMYVGQIETKTYQETEDGLQDPPSFFARPSPIRPGEIRIERPTHHALGFEWPVRGDDNRNAAASVSWRKAGEAAWTPGIPLLRMMYEVVDRFEYPQHGGSCVAPNMFAGSVLNLEPGTKYEVRLTLTDPDGGSAEHTVRAATRPWPTAFEEGRRLHVYPPEHKGARQEPAYAGLRAAYAAAKSGDVLMIHAGRYVVPPEREIDRCAYVLNKKATLDRPIVIRGAGDGEAVFEGATNTLFNVTGSAYHYFEDLVLRDCDRFFFCAQGTGLAVQRCHMSGSKYPLWLLGWDCQEFTISDNVIVGHTPKLKGGHAVWIKGQGHAVCYNHIYSFWDGIDITGYYPPPEPERRNTSIDFYGNRLHDFFDDCIEIDFGSHNIRVWNNLCYNSHTGISTQPVYGGPAYIYRNVVFNTNEPAFKPNNWPAGLVVCNNTLLSRAGFSSSSMWQNSRILNNLILSDLRGPFHTGTPTPETCRVDYNGLHTDGRASNWQSYRPWQNDPKAYRGRNYSRKEDFLRDTGFGRHGIWQIGWGVFRNAPEGFFRNLAYDREKSATENAVELSALDLRPKEDGRAVDAGVILSGITDGYRGRAPDLGAHEAGDPRPLYGPRR